MYKVILVPQAEKSFRSLDRPTQLRIANKIDWLAQNADKIIHQPLKNMPEELKGLCRTRIGNYRFIYWKGLPVNYQIR